MEKVNVIFQRIKKITEKEGQCDFISLFLKNRDNESQNIQSMENTNTFHLQKSFIQMIIKEIDDLASDIKNDNTILISVKNQKLLRTCYQLITSLGITLCLIPGLGISLMKRCTLATVLLPLNLSDEQKYEMLVDCTDFFTRSYEVPVLKSIIITFHLSDYLAALIQLSFAPLKKPGSYSNFIMTQEKYEKFNLNKQKYLQIYENIVTNCFQPILMKELLVLQSVVDPPPPVFVKRVIAKEMSRRLLAPGGLLSLIRCFIENYGIDTGFEWKKIDMICKIVTVKHGNCTEDIYLNNICSQLKQILLLNNTHYLATAGACMLNLNEKYQQSKPVTSLVEEIFQAFDYDYLLENCSLPGTILLSPQEIEHKVNILHACLCTMKMDWPVTLILPNLYLLFLLGVNCTKNEDMMIKLKYVILKCLEQLNKNDICPLLKMFLFGKENKKSKNIIVYEYEAGLAIKYVSTDYDYPKNDALCYFLKLFNTSTSAKFAESLFETSLQILIDLTIIRQNKNKRETLLSEADDYVLIDNYDEQYANILQLLTEISTSAKVISSLKKDPSMVLHFIKYFILENHNNAYEECVTISLILLNTILSNSNKAKCLLKKFNNLVPVLKEIAEDNSNFNTVLGREALSLITSRKHQQTETPYGMAISNVFNDLLPVKAHGIIELTKLIDNKDTETISKKHYIFCLFQEELKNSDSYVYLAAINGIASLATHCTEDVLHVICKEFLQLSSEQNFINMKEGQNKITELRMKIGDIIVKVTKRLGDMVIVHKSLLLNTVLCACRDEDPLIRTSALSNLAEISLVLHYKIGSMIYEVLLCIWSIIETDKAVECRRAAVMVISSLLKGLGKDTLIQLKENLLPIYRTLKTLHEDPYEDRIVSLHAQIALEELNDIVNQFLFPELKMEKQMFVMDKAENIFK